MDDSIWLVIHKYFKYQSSSMRQNCLWVCFCMTWWVTLRQRERLSPLYKQQLQEMLLKYLFMGIERISDELVLQKSQGLLRCIMGEGRNCKWDQSWSHLMLCREVLWFLWNEWLTLSTINLSLLLIIRNQDGIKRPLPNIIVTGIIQNEKLSRYLCYVLQNLN